MLNSNKSEKSKCNFKAEYFYKIKHICESEPQCVFESWKIKSEKNLNNWYKYLSVFMHSNYNQNSEQFNKTFKNKCIYCISDFF